MYSSEPRSNFDMGRSFHHRKRTWDKIPNSICDGKFLVHSKSVLGKGSFGVIFNGYSMQREKECAVKFEPIGCKDPQLLNESRLYRILWEQKKTVGIPHLYWWGSHGNYNILVIEKLGPSLEDLFNFCNRRFSLKTCCMLAEQLISRIQFIHSKRFIHRDIKPENFLMGVGKKGHHLYICDYGLAKKYYIDKRHIPKKVGVPLTGTVRYTSINSHNGVEQSRRDDLESIGYMLIYFAKGSLPWQGIPESKKRKKYNKIKKKKIDISIKKLTKDLPPAFYNYMKYVKSLKFMQEPDYDMLRSLFRELAKLNGHEYDFIFDWNERFAPIYKNSKVSEFKQNEESENEEEGESSENENLSNPTSIPKDEFDELHENSPIMTRLKLKKREFILELKQNFREKQRRRSESQ